MHMHTPKAHLRSVAICLLDKVLMLFPVVNQWCTITSSNHLPSSPAREVRQQFFSPPPFIPVVVKSLPPTRNQSKFEWKIDGRRGVVDHLPGFVLAWRIFFRGTDSFLFLFLLFSFLFFFFFFFERFIERASELASERANTLGVERTKKIADVN